MVLNGKEDNMLIGDPYKFAVLFDRVKKWNPSLTDNNGFFALCIDGKLFPDEIENAVIPVGVRDVKVALSGIPVDEKIFDMDSKDAILILYIQSLMMRKVMKKTGIMILDICFLQMN